VISGSADSGAWVGGHGEREAELSLARVITLCNEEIYSSLSCRNEVVFSWVVG
jgi:hypothetical protein